MSEIRLDSQGITNIFSTLFNPLTGMGTVRDKMGHARVNTVLYPLDRTELDALPRKSGMISRLCFKLPEDCAADWMRLDLGEANFNGEDVLLYLENLAEKEGRLGAREGFQKAASLGRQYGDGFILIGIADGKEPHEPVNAKNIRSLEWLKVCDRYELYPDHNNYHDPEFYHFYSGEHQTWHRDRVLRFPGKKIFSRYNRNNGFNDSVIQSFFDAWSQWEQGVAAGAQMLVEWDQAKMTMQGLSQLLLEDIQQKTDKNQKAVAKRLESVSVNRSLYNTVLLDALETLEYLNHTYTGADQVMIQIKDRLASETDLPRHILFNENGSASGLSSSNTAGLSQRYAWAECKESWSNRVFAPELLRLCRYAMLAKDGVSRGKLAEKYEVISASEVVLTAQEKMMIQLQASNRDTRNIAAGIYTSEEARSQFETAKFTGQVVLSKNPNLPKDRKDSTARKILQWRGEKIIIEYLPGDKRHGHILKHGYGYIRSYIGEDKEALDCYISADYCAVGGSYVEEKIFRIKQLSLKDSCFDEWKYMIGFVNQEKAQEAYLSAFPIDIGDLLFGGIQEVFFESLDEFRRDRDDGLTPKQRELHVDALTWEEPSNWYD
ncbi:MAG: phage portal protein [Cyanobacteria bacterium P01_E01_bin.42]